MIEENLIPISDTIKDNVNLFDSALNQAFLNSDLVTAASGFAENVAKIVMKARFGGFYRYENTEEGKEALINALASDLDNFGTLLLLLYIELNSDAPDFNKLESYTDTLLRTGTVDNTGSAGSKTANTPTGISASTDFEESYTNIRQSTSNTNLETRDTSDARTVEKTSDYAHKLEMINKYSIKYRNIVIRAFSRELYSLA